jgi:hypothetical protein
MHRGIIAYAAAIIVIVVLWYAYTDFALPFQHKTATTTTMAVNSSIVPPAVYNCTGAYLKTTSSNAAVTDGCSWGGGALGLWAGSGGSVNAIVTVTGQDKKVYVNNTFTNPCSSFYSIYSLPSQNYTILLQSGTTNRSYQKPGCTDTLAELNAPPTGNATVYSDIINGDFVTGTYYGWDVEGKAFGTAPLNITKANSQGCYPEGASWSGYNGIYFASTYGCGYTSQAEGNLTSFPFITTMPFLNFQIIGSGGERGYIAVTYDNKTYIKAYFSTKNISTELNGAFVFTNATLPLATVIGIPIRIKIVTDETTPIDFLAVGDFKLSGAAAQTRQGILVNVSLAK